MKKAVSFSFDAFRRGDLTAVLGFCAEDFALHHPMPEGAWPGAGNLQGNRCHTYDKPYSYMKQYLPQLKEAPLKRPSQAQ